MSTHRVSVDQYRASLVEQLRAKDDYGFCAAVSPYLAARPGDTYVRLMAVRSFLKLNLIEPAKLLLQEGVASCEADAQLLEARSSIEALGGSQLAWESQLDVLEANLAALSGRGADVSPIRDAWRRNRSRYELYRDSFGEFQVRCLLSDADWRWYPGLGRHSVVDENRELPDDASSEFPGPYLFDGLGLGRYFERVYRGTVKTFLDYSCALYVIERDAGRLAVAFHLNDWSELLADPRVLLFAGDHALDSLTRLLRDEPDLPLPARLFQTGAVFDAPATDATIELSRVTEFRDRAIQESLAALEARYAERDLDHWSARFDAALSGTDRPLRILASVSRHTTFLKYSVRDAQRAFHALGHSCTLLTEDRNHTAIGPLTYHAAIREVDPDVFFNLDHLRPEFGAIIPANLPVLTWDQDHLPHVITKENIAGIARHDFIAGCSKGRCLALGAQPSQLLQARVPTCPEQFAGDDLTPEEMVRFKCDVSYVSHASQTPEGFHRRERAQHSDARTVALLDTLHQIVPEAVGTHRVLDRYGMSEVIAKACATCGISSLDPAFEGRLRNWYIWRLADRVFRHQALEWVAQWSRRTGSHFRIYGNGWESHPSLAGFAAGPVQNGRELLCVYRASKINLQLMPAGFIHQRALDGLAAGGFFMSRLVPHDFHGGCFASLDRRIRELGIDDSETLLAHPDTEIRAHLTEILGPFVNGGDHDAFDVVEWIRSSSEILHPDQVFEGFERVVFDSAEQFAARADAFLNDDATRRRTAEAMRRVVVDRFSYRAAMLRFLEAMRDHLRLAAGQATSGASRSPA